MGTVHKVVFAEQPGGRWLAIESVKIGGHFTNNYAEYASLEAARKDWGHIPNQRVVSANDPDRALFRG
jgi:hypothetical protein